MSTQVYEKMTGESDLDWWLRAAEALDTLTEAFEDGGDLDRMVITTIKSAGGGYSVTVTAVRNDKEEADAEAT